MSKEELIIFVHGFDGKCYDDQKAFNKAKKDVLKSDSKLIILTSCLEEVKLQIGNRECKMFRTPMCSPDPEIGWEKFSQIIREYNLPVLFIGAELYLNSKGNPSDGCVLAAYKNTDVGEKRIDPSKCWIG